MKPTNPLVGPSAMPRTSPQPTARDGDGVIQQALQAIRKYLGLRIAYISEIVGDHSVFRSVDAPGFEHLIKPGDRRALTDVYCRHILEGRLPELLPDASAHGFASTLPITASVPIGAHVSVPIRLADGSVYGMFCCLDPEPDLSLTDRDLRAVKAFADIAAAEISWQLNATLETALKAARIDAAVTKGAIRIVYQPIADLVTGKAVGFESLSRFEAEPERPPNEWFAEADEIGKGVALEYVAIDVALRGLERLPRDAFLTVNISPDSACDGGLRRLFKGYPLDRIVLEITEHSCFDDFDRLTRALAPLRARGLRVAVDDAGAGYSSLQEILQLEPDIIKLDRLLVNGIGSDPTRAALVRALVSFCRETGSMLVGEGVETEEERVALRELGVELAQGYLLGRPVPLADLR